MTCAFQKFRRPHSYLPHSCSFLRRAAALSVAAFPAKPGRVQRMAEGCALSFAHCLLRPFDTPASPPLLFHDRPVEAPASVAGTRAGACSRTSLLLYAIHGLAGRFVLAANTAEIRT